MDCERDQDLDNEEMQILVTRAGRYPKECPLEDTPSCSTPTSTKEKSSPRNSSFFKCKEHYTGKSKSWTDINKSCAKCVNYSKAYLNFPNGILPRGKEVLSYLLTLKHNNTGKRINNEHECAMDLVLHWIFCNVYPVSVAAVKKHISTMFFDYNKLKKDTSESKGPTYWKRFEAFIEIQNALFDIKGIKFEPILLN